MNDDFGPTLLRIGQAQIDAMFARQDEGPAMDDSQFLPLVEGVLDAFEEAKVDESVVEKLWNHAYSVYDRMCREADPRFTTEENRQLMQSYLLRKRKK